MDANTTPTPQITYDAIRIAVRENLPPVLEAAKTLEETMAAISTKINTLQDAVDTPADAAKNQEMTNAVNGLLKHAIEVEKQFKVWHEKLNVACVMIKLVYTLQGATSEA